MENPRDVGNPPLGGSAAPPSPLHQGQQVQHRDSSLPPSDKPGWFHPSPRTSFNFAYAAEKPWASAGGEEPQANSSLISHSSGQGLINVCRGGGRIFLEAE